jgi:uncharacterized protein YjeT (DUF2065 family)
MRLFFIFSVGLTIILVILVIIAMVYPEIWGRIFRAIFEVTVPLAFLSGFVLLILSLWASAVRKGVSLGSALLIACILAFLAYLTFLLCETDWKSIVKEILEHLDVFEGGKFSSGWRTHKEVLVFLVLLGNGTYLSKRRRFLPFEFVGVNMILFVLFWLWLNIKA